MTTQVQTESIGIAMEQSEVTNQQNLVSMNLFSTHKEYLEGLKNFVDTNDRNRCIKLHALKYFIQQKHPSITDIEGIIEILIPIGIIPKDSQEIFQGIREITPLEFGLILDLTEATLDDYQEAIEHDQILSLNLETYLFKKNLDDKLELFWNQKIPFEVLNLPAGWRLSEMSEGTGIPIEMCIKLKGLGMRVFEEHFRLSDFKDLTVDQLMRFCYSFDIKPTDFLESYKQDELPKSLILKK